MRVVLVTTSYPDATPGSEAAGGFVADFAASLTDHAAVTVVAAGGRDDTGAEGEVEVVRFAVPRLPLSLLRVQDPRDWTAIVKTLRRGGQAVADVVRDRQPDHIFALWVLPSGYWARRAAQRHGTPYSVWALGSDIWSLARIPLLRSVLRTVLRDAHGIFADGLQLARDVTQLSARECGFLPSSRRLPVVAARNCSATSPYRLAFLGRWHPNKGIDLLLDALERLDDADWDRIASLRICGGGPLHDEVVARGRALADAGRAVEVGGFLDANSAAELLAWADYLVLPSRIESVPVILSDAAQAGTPLIATPVGDLPQLLSQHAAGVLADEASADGLVRALREALGSDPQQFAAGLDALATAFDVRNAAARFASFAGGGDGD